MQKTKVPLKDFEKKNTCTCGEQSQIKREEKIMTPGELILRVLLGLLCPPLGIIGMRDVGCGTLLLMCLLTLCFFVPGQVVAIFLVVREYLSGQTSQ